MLANISVKNLALIRSLSVDLGEGFSVLTGETGAGKTLLLDSLKLFLSTKGEKELIRHGEDSLRVSLYFDSFDEEEEERLSALLPDWEKEDGILLERQVFLDGKSRNRIGTKQVPFSLMSKVAKLLFAIHGQHDTIGLTDSKTHPAYLDSAFSPEDEAVLAEYSALYKERSEILREIDRLKEVGAGDQTALDLIDYKLSEIAKAKIRVGEEAVLKKRLEELKSSSKIASALSTASRAVNGGDKGRGAAYLLEVASQRLALLGDLEKFRTLAETLQGLALEVQAAGEELSALTTQMMADEDPEILSDKIGRRLNVIWRILAKYGPTEEEVLATRDKLLQEKDDFFGAKDKIAELMKKRDALEKRLRALAASLHTIRKDLACKLEQNILSVLQFLDMPKVRFSVQITPKDSFSPTGLDEVEFFIATNAGEGLKKLSEIASGGELSRIMLALQIRFGKAKDAGTLIFDEIDTGISGSTSQKIGVCLRALGETKQVLCVTHSAQVASLGNAHFRVAKSEADGRTETSVTPLSDEEALLEVARILGGQALTAQAKENAAQLRLEGEKEYRNFEKL